jgi:hypothetical protein
MLGWIWKATIAYGDGAVYMARDTVQATDRANAIKLAKAALENERADLARKRGVATVKRGTFRLWLPQYTSVGSYTILYVDREGDCYCARCAARVDTWQDDPRIMQGAFDEGAPEECVTCGNTIESSYGDPDATEAADA